MRPILFHTALLVWRRAGLGVCLLAVVAVVGFRLAAQQQPPAPQPQLNAAVISGLVVDARGAPLDKVTVLLTAANYSSSVLTGADGKFEFKSLAPAQYLVSVQAVRFRKAQKAVTITRADEVAAPLTLTLTPFALHVIVYDAANQPLGGVAVTLSPQGSADAAAAAGRVITDRNGDAYFGSLAPGSYTLTAVLRGYDEYRNNNVFISPGLTTDFPLQLTVAPLIPINANAATRHSMPNLPGKPVRALYQDSDGWMWFGTDKGLARFNGAEFKSSAGSASLYAAFAGEDVRAIGEDGDGFMWVASTKGIRRISKTGKTDGRWAAGVEAHYLLIDSRNTVWIATTAGIFKFTGRAYELLDEGRGLPSNDARALIEDRQGRVLALTAKGLARIDNTQITAVELAAGPPSASPSTSAASAAPSSAASSSSSSSSSSASSSSPKTTSGATATTSPAAQLHASELQNLFIEPNGNLWLATAKGAWRFDAATLDAQRFDTGNRLDLTKARIISPEPTQAIGQDSAGRLWLALADGGVLLYDAALDQSQRVSFLEQDTVAAMLNGREGTMWFATENGAVQADLYSFVNFTTSRGLPDNDVSAVVEAPAGISPAQNENTLLCLTSTGASRFDNERFVPLERFRSNLQIRNVAFDNAGAAWFATDQGALKFFEETLTQFTEGKGLAASNVRFVKSLAGGAALAFATSKGVSIYRDNLFRELEELDGYDARHIFEDTDGRLWISTSRGVVSYNPQTEELNLLDAARGLLDNDARWVARFNGELMIATRAGVQVYYERPGGGGVFRLFDSEPTNTLFVDRDNFLWLGTDTGQVKKYAVVEGHLVFTIYSGDVHALIGNRIHSISEDSQGQIWIATDKGAVRHKPMRVPPLTQVSVKIESQLTEEADAYAQEVPSGNQRLTFRLTGVSHSRQVQYLYRVNPEGGNERWELLPAQAGVEREVIILDIKEGQNNFDVITLNRDLYGNPPLAALSLQVNAPFYKRWWFYALLLALGGAVATALIVARQKSQREFILPKELREFVPVEPNPYIVGNPIRTETMFYGREDDFRYVQTKLEGAAQGVVIVFCGDRRVGKSSILFQVMNGRLGKRFIPVFIDMQEMVITSDSEFFARTARLICEAVAQAGVRVNAPRFDERNPYPLFLDFLDDVLAAIGDRTLLLLLDEYELMESKVDDGKLSHEFFTFLAGLMDNKERLSLIFTGSRRLEERDKKYWRELLRRSLFRKVGFLTGKDTLRLITEPVEGKVVYGRGAVESICRLTAGQPFYTQVICQNMIDYLNEHEQNWITLADLEKVTAEIVDHPLPQMIYAWEALSDDEKLVLSLLANVLPDGHTYATARDLRTAVKANDYPVNLSETTIRLTLEEMFRRELLDKNSSDGFRVKIDLFRLWIRRSHSIWQVVKEVRTL